MSPVHATLAFVSLEENDIFEYVNSSVAVPLRFFPLNLKFPLLLPNVTPSDIPLDVFY